MKKIVGRVQLVQKADTEKWKTSNKAGLESKVDSSNLNGLWIGFSFQYHTISDHKINIIRKHPIRECKFKAVCLELSRNSELALQAVHVIMIAY